MQSEESHLRQFGYESKLNRTLSLFSTIGLAFSYISPVVGVYSLFGQGLSNGGPSFLWGLPLVVGGQMLVALVFAELAVAMPIAGALYQWGRRLVHPRYGWFVGWIYGWALIITIASIDLNAPPYVLRVFGWEASSIPQWLTMLIGVALLVLHTLANLVGIKMTSVLTNIGLVTEIGMTVVLAVFLILRGVSTDQLQPLSVLWDGVEANSHGTLILGSFSFRAFLPALLAQAFVFYGFESAASVSEEVQSAQESVPRAMVVSLGCAAVVTFCLELALLLTVPNMPAALANGGADAINQILAAHVGETGTRILSFFLSISYISCAGAVQASCARLLFSYGRDKALPWSDMFEHVSPHSRVPDNALWVVAGSALAIMGLTFVNVGHLNMNVVVVNYAVVGIYLAFQSVVFARLYLAFVKRQTLNEFVSKAVQAYKRSTAQKVRANELKRLKPDYGFSSKLTEPVSSASSATTSPTRLNPDHFTLGDWSVGVAVAAQLYGSFMIINMCWPRPSEDFAQWTTLLSTLVLVIVGAVLARFGTFAELDADTAESLPILTKPLYDHNSSDI